MKHRKIQEKNINTEIILSSRNITHFYIRKQKKELPNIVKSSRLFLQLIKIFKHFCLSFLKSTLKAFQDLMLL